MKEKITDKTLHEFLKDFENNSETFILEEGKEKNEILGIAKSQGINLKNNKDLAGFKTIYTFADKANKNRARLPQDKLIKALPTLKGKPVDIDHNRRFVVGHYIDYRYLQKEGKVVAYGVFYKSNFGKEWETAKQLFKAKKLATSYEIWSPKSKRRYLNDGTYELLSMEIAGGALLFKEEPAFEDAKVLELAKVLMEQLPTQDELVYASKDKYKEDEIIYAENYFLNEVKKNIAKLEQEKTQKPSEAQPEAKAEEPTQEKPKEENAPAETPKVEETPPTPENLAIKCANCQHSFETFPISEVQCPNCKAIVNSTGELLYPPQIIDFKVICPACRTNNWRILANNEKTVDLSCLNCSKQYRVEYAVEETTNAVGRIGFLYSGSATCPQCNYVIPISGSSRAKDYDLKCPRCNLNFQHHTTENETFKKIISIAEILPEVEKPKEEVKSEEKPKEQPKAEEKVETPSEVEGGKEEMTEPKKETEKKDEIQVEKSQVSLENKALEAQTKQFQAEMTEIVEAKKTKQEMRGTVVFPSDSTKVKDNKDHFPINDENQARNALARVAQYDKVPSWYDGTLAEVKTKVRNAVKKAFPSIKVTSSKALRKAVKKIKALQKASVDAKAKEETLVKGIKKVSSRLIEAKAEIKKITEETDKKIGFYMENAKKIHERRVELELGEDEISDKDILNDILFEKAKLEKENALLRAQIENETVASEVVGDKDAQHSPDWYAEQRKAIDKKAFGHTRKNEE